jgi:aspartate racemase
MKNEKQRRPSMKAGIIGGIGPESTVDYYKSIIDGYRNAVGDGSYPELVIDSIDMTTMLRLVDAGQTDKLTELLLRSLECLHRAGAQVAIIASNTPHVVFDALKTRSPLPLLSIVEEACKSTAAQGLKKVGLLGTAFTMDSSFYQVCFAARGIEVIVPKAEERRYIQQKIFTELEGGLIKPQTRAELIIIINRMARDEAIGAAILGCTELPLILHDGDCAVPLLNTVQIHVQALVRFMTRQGGQI